MIIPDPDDLPAVQPLRPFRLGVHRANTLQTHRLPDDALVMMVVINGIVESSQRRRPAFALRDGVISWLPENAGYEILIGDDFVVYAARPVAPALRPAPPTTMAQ